MNIKIVAASALAIALFAGTAIGQENGEPPQATEQPAAPVEQPVAPAAEAAPAELPPEVMQLLADARAPSELSVEELKQRAALARKFSKMEGLSEDARKQLADISKAARGELMAREQQAQPAEPPAAPAAQPEPQQAQQPVAEPPPTPKAEEPPAPKPKAAEAPAAQPESQPAQPQETKSATPLPRALATLLADKRPMNDLSDEDLKKRTRRIEQFQSLPDLDPEIGARLQALKGEAEAEQAKRQQAAQPPAAPAEPQPPAAAEAPPPAAPAEPAPAQQAQPAAPATEAPAQPPVAAAPPPPPPPPPKAPVAAQAPLPPPAAAPAPAVKPEAKDTKLDSNVANPEAEAKAQQFLNDPRPAERLSDDQLRQRLDAIRELMAGNELSRQTERALRQKLMTEREILRQRVAAAEAAAQQQAQDPTQQQSQQQGKQRPRRQQWGQEAPPDWQWSDEQALNDRRRSEDLRDYELRRRLDIYRRAAADQRYEQAYRDYWRAVIARDQYVLQQRLVQARRDRQAEWAAGQEDAGWNVNIGIGRRPPPQQDVFAAEVDDQELADVLVSKPRRKFNRRFTIDEIQQQPEVRAALPRVEVDTVKFGFNEAFVRPEEIDKLDRIGEIIERIVRQRPGEVFLIEGHTDAVGSDAANLVLSRKRAEAVKKALTTYYLIPPQALRTVGYGERYLKIPTGDPEPENRRVSVSRATDVIGLQ